MNIRKPTDYTAMFAALDKLMAAQLPQMELYCETPASHLSHSRGPLSPQCTPYARVLRSLRGIP